MRALVTGANGFIGSHLVEKLVRRGYSVRCLVRETSDVRPIEGFSVEICRGDFRDLSFLEYSVQGVDEVFHLAALISALSWREYQEANITATRNLLAACSAKNPGLRKFVFVSSISASGPSEKGRAKTEHDPCLPVSDYGRSKLAAEQAVLELAADFPAVIIRPANVLGPRQKELLGAIKLIQKRIMPLIGTGEPQTSLCDVEDVVDALILAAESPAANGRVYFLAYPQPYAWQDISDAIARTLGIRRFILRVPYAVQIGLAVASELATRWTRKRPRLTREEVRTARRDHWIFDGSKIRRELGFEPRISLSETIAKTIAWHREHGDI
jgi:nucleoside-diphosphate-sugar epimerase